MAITLEGQPRRVTLLARRGDGDDLEGLYLVLFAETDETDETATDVTAIAAGGDHQEEFQAARSQLQGMIEQYILPSIPGGLYYRPPGPALAGSGTIY